MIDENDSQPMLDYARGEFPDEILSVPVRENGDRMQAAGLESNKPTAETTGSGTVNYYFPVEIEVIGGLTEHERASLEAGIWSQLTDALERGM